VDRSWKRPPASSAVGTSFLGYSPERINPGDCVHALDKIVKVVAGQTPEVTAWLAEVYGRVTEAGVFCAASIRTAEAAKVIENAQRDINIAFVNEVTEIFNRMDVSVYDVLAAARTKWNFLDFRPGLVGGHCIGVDPYYLAHCSETLGFDPQVILAGRRTNDSMGQYFAERVLSALNGAASAPAGSRRILVLGLTFKENVPDLRNSKVVDMIASLRHGGCSVEVHAPWRNRTRPGPSAGPASWMTCSRRSASTVSLAPSPTTSTVAWAPATSAASWAPAGSFSICATSGRPPNCRRPCVDIRSRQCKGRQGE
jgi:nucleotide sugar dehydrogenase